MNDPDVVAGLLLSGAAILLFAAAAVASVAVTLLFTLLVHWSELRGKREVVIDLERRTEVAAMRSDARRRLNGTGGES